jgi:hypothetical protein
MEIRPVNQEILGPAGAEQNRSNPRPAGTSETPNTLGSDFQGYITRALAASNDQVDVEQIRSELNAGRFDSPEAIRQTAENLFARGI